MDNQRSKIVAQPNIDLWGDYVAELRDDQQSRIKKWRQENQKLKGIEERQQRDYDSTPWYRRLGKVNPRNCTSIARIMLNEVMWYPAHRPVTPTIEGYWTWLSERQQKIEGTKRKGLR